jgi:hypothetical protein
LVVLIWIISNAGKKKTPPRGRQPWDEARRRQSLPPLEDKERKAHPVQPVREQEQEILKPMVEPEREVPPPTRPLPKLQDWGRELREALEGEFFPEQEPMEAPVWGKTVSKRKKVYRQKNKAVRPLVAPVVPAVAAISSVDDKKPAGQQELLPFSPQGVVQGIIMAEILQPPRSRRWMRR